jgi:hypothetical protein
LVVGEAVRWGGGEGLAVAALKEKMFGIAVIRQDESKKERKREIGGGGRE